jgi:hypothetical protein
MILHWLVCKRTWPEFNHLLGECGQLVSRDRLDWSSRFKSIGLNLSGLERGLSHTFGYLVRALPREDSDQRSWYVSILLFDDFIAFDYPVAFFLRNRPILSSLISSNPCLPIFPRSWILTWRHSSLHKSALFLVSNQLCYLFSSRPP